MNTPDADTAAPPVTKDAPTLWRVDDALWAELQPLLMIAKPRKQPGRPRLDDRAMFDGLIWLARTGSQWAALPRAFGAKSTVHARFQEWVEYGCLARAWARLLEVYDDDIGLDWQWQSADGCLVKAPLGKLGARRAGSDRAQPHGSRHDPCGVPRHQTAPADRWRGHPAGGRDQRGQSARHEAAGRAARRAGLHGRRRGRRGAQPLPRPGRR